MLSRSAGADGWGCVGREERRTSGIARSASSLLLELRAQLLNYLRHSRVVDRREGRGSFGDGIV
jgi:hypothetical protein